MKTVLIISDEPVDQILAAAAKLGIFATAGPTAIAPVLEVKTAIATPVASPRLKKAHPWANGQKKAGRPSRQQIIEQDDYTDFADLDAAGSI